MENIGGRKMKRKNNPFLSERKNPDNSLKGTFHPFTPMFPGYNRVIRQ